jgi:hypothetical protein
MLALHHAPERATPDLPEQDPGARDQEANDRAILCAACKASITSARHRVASHGSHEHRFMNPAGLTFHIGCFATAIGCTTVGPPSLEYAWFPGYAWRLALCGQCDRQLGWHFRGEGSESFFGLILDRLRERDPE